MRARLWLSGQFGWTLPQNTYSYSKNLLASLAATPQHWLHSGLFLDNHSIHKLDRFKLKSNIYISSCGCFYQGQLMFAAAGDES